MQCFSTPAPAQCQQHAFLVLHQEKQQLIAVCILYFEETCLKHQLKRIALHKTNIWLVFYVSVSMSKSLILLKSFSSSFQRILLRE
jgi:hypothetical protein